MATKLKYDPIREVEASVSTDPDDISRVTIKIRAKAAAAIADGAYGRRHF
ncbi:MAG: hypothetical protein NTW28_36760 [Candidatus Solibacter sp.]|nr:hypothetical protein [Candidatus Solibacter sp.]